MGQTQNKYHITDDGKIYRINDDGSFSEVGDVEAKSNGKKLGNNEPKTIKDWLRENWLFALSLLFTFVWFCMAYTNREYWSNQEFDGQGSWYEVLEDRWGDDIMWYSILVVAFQLVVGLWTVNLFKNAKTGLLVNCSLAVVLLGATLIISGSCCDEFVQSFVPACLSTMTLLIYVVQKVRKQMAGIDDE